MNVIAIVRQLCAPCRRLIHQSRATSVEVVAEAIAVGGRIAPSHVGRSLRSTALPKHSIKRVDRLLSNRHLHSEWTHYYAALAERVLGNVARPIVVIDWSGTVKGLHTLAAAVPMDGRALTIYAEVHPESKYSNREVQTRFLQVLQKVLGPGRRPIIVADAGFRAPFMNAVKALGWDYVVRVRGRVRLRSCGSNTWLLPADLYCSAQTKAMDLGLHRITLERRRFVTEPVDTRLLLSKKPKRKGAKRPMRAPICGMKAGHGVVQAAREPWLLATSLDLPAKRVFQLYALRMQIEETFRDCKSHRYGWSLRHVSSRCHARMTTLLMLSAIAMTAVIMLGIAIEKRHEHWRYQANTRKRRVLSHFSLGRYLIARGDLSIASVDVLHIARAHFRQIAKPNSNTIRGDPLGWQLRSFAASQLRRWLRRWWPVRRTGTLCAHARPYVLAVCGARLVGHVTAFAQ